MLMLWRVVAACLLVVAFAAGQTALCRVAADCGCPNDGKTDGTECIRKCVQQCHLSGPDRATVVFELGTFLTGAFNLTSNLTLVVSNGSVLLATTDPAGFPVVPALPSYGTCRDDGYPKAHELFRHQAFISGWNIDNVEITGGGIIDGQGAPWWQRHADKALDYGRPRLIEPMFCRNFQLTNLHLHNSPFWTVHPYSCDNVYVAGLEIYAPDSAPNTDGIDPDSTKNVLIENCVIQVGDDAIAIKSGMDYAGRQFNRSSENIVIRNSWFKSRHVAIGSEESGGVRNVTVHDCMMGGPHYSGGIHLKAERGRGGYIRDITFQNIAMVNLSDAISVSMFYSDARPPTNKTATPQFSALAFINITGTNIGAPGEFVGLPESSIDGVTFELVQMNTRDAWKCTDVVHVTQTQSAPPLVC